MRWRSSLLVLAVLVNGSLGALAADLPWPRWRGPNDSGSVAEGEYPVDLLDKKFVQWKVKLPGIGCSTPAVLSDRIFVTARSTARTASSRSIGREKNNGGRSWPVNVGASIATAPRLIRRR